MSINRGYKSKSNFKLQLTTWGSFFFFNISESAAIYTARFNISKQSQWWRSAEKDKEEKNNITKRSAGRRTSLSKQNPCMTSIYYAGVEQRAARCCLLVCVSLPPRGYISSKVRSKPTQLTLMRPRVTNDVYKT